jgi:phytanoyl-CoA hydroxylase
MNGLQESFEKDGFVHVKNVLNSEQVNTLKQTILDLADGSDEEQLQTLDVIYSQGLVNSMHSLASLSESESLPFNSITAQSEIPKITELLLGSPAVLHNSEAFLKRAHIGLGATLHQDAIYFCIEKHRAVNVWMALDESDQTNGTIFYLKGSHRWGLIPHTTLGLHNFTCQDHPQAQALERTYIRAKPGDCVFHHMLTCHGSDLNTSERPRMALTRLYRSCEVAEDVRQRKARTQEAMSLLLESAKRGDIGVKEKEVLFEILSRINF